MEYTEIRQIIQQEYEKQTTDTNFNFISRFAMAVYEAQQQVKNLNVPAVSKSLPDGFWFDDEHGTTVTVIGTIDKWCMVEDIEHEEPYVLPLEYVTSIYEESKEGNVC